MIIAIDSSIRNAGYAITDGGKLLRSGVIRTKAETTPDRLLELHDAVNKIMADTFPAGPPVRAVVEIPEAFAFDTMKKGNGKPINRESLQILSQAVGAITLTLKTWGISVEHVKPRQWKGNRLKVIDQMNATAIKGSKVSPDEADAIMLAEWYEKRMKMERMMQRTGT